jgi:hypothetical protein
MRTVEAGLKVVYSYNSTKTSATRASPPRDYTHMVYICLPGFRPAKQRKKKDSDWKSSSAMAFDMWSFL